MGAGASALEALPAKLDEAEAAGGEKLDTIRFVLESGIAGQTRSKMDVKCLHAQLADTLCRSHSNGVASETMRHMCEQDHVQRYGYDAHDGSGYAADTTGGGVRDRLHSSPQ